MLFKTTAEVKDFLPVIGTTQFENMAIFISQAERDYLIPIIGQEQYDELEEAYQNDEGGSGDAMSEEEVKLLDKCQAVLAQYFFYLWIPTAQLSIGDNGIRIATTDTLKTAFQWQIDDLRRSVMRAAGSAMDSLLEFLEKNKDDYETWAASDSYTEFKECFIPTTKQFSKLQPVLGDSRLNFLAIRSTMVKIQDLVIQAELGDDLYEEVKEQHIHDDLSEENEALLELIQKALAPLTMNSAITELSVSIDDRGILNFDNTTGGQTINSKLPAKDQMLLKLEQKCEREGKAYLQKLKDFLLKNIDDYPLYKNSPGYDADTSDSDFKTDTEDSLFNAM